MEKRVARFWAAKRVRAILGSEEGARALLFSLTRSLHQNAWPSLYYIQNLLRLFSTDSSTYKVMYLSLIGKTSFLSSLSFSSVLAHTTLVPHKPNVVVMVDRESDLNKFCAFRRLSPLSLFLPPAVQQCSAQAQWRRVTKGTKIF